MLEKKSDIEKLFSGERPNLVLAAAELNPVWANTVPCRNIFGEALRYLI